MVDRGRFLMRCTIIPNIYICVDGLVDVYDCMYDDMYDYCEDRRRRWCDVGGSPDDF